MGSSVVVATFPIDSLHFELVLCKSKLSACMKEQAEKSPSDRRPFIGINAAFYALTDMSPFLGFKNYDTTIPCVAGLPFVSVVGGKINISLEMPESGDYFQTGPLLYWEGKGCLDLEYFKRNESLFDCYINETKNPRSVLALDDDNVYLIVIDGRSETSAGLFLEEVISFLKTLNIKSAVNLDGGSSSELICCDEILNVPSGNSSLPLGEERIISSALIGYDLAELDSEKRQF